MDPTSPEQIARRGWALYETKIRPAVEPMDNDRFLIVDVDSGRYLLADDELAAFDRARERCLRSGKGRSRVRHSAYRRRLPIGRFSRARARR